MDILAHYLQRHALPLPPGAGHLPAPAPGLKLCVVIPSLAEKDGLFGVLDSLAAGSRRLAESEALVVVNHSDAAGEETVRNNLATLQGLEARPGDGLRVLAVDCASPGRALPAATAGVGLARRIGMDLALRRLAAAGAGESGAIACLDADSPVAPGYADAVLAAFDRPDPPPAGTCDYIHPTPVDSASADAIAAYELWLRYFEAGLRAAGSLFAFPTIGSCMAVSCRGYAQALGMPCRQAGEDFHFLRKVAKTGGFRRVERIAGARVFPAARLSDRVPFGTGRAMRRCQDEGAEVYLRVDPPEAFLELRPFFSAAAAARDRPDLGRERLAPALLSFLDDEGAWLRFERFRRTYPSGRHFALAVQHWFDSLRIIRYAHRRGREAGQAPIGDALAAVMAVVGRGGEAGRVRQAAAGMPADQACRFWLAFMRRAEIFI